MKLSIGVYFPFHKDRIMEMNNREMILNEAAQIVGKDCLIECALVNRQPTQLDEKSPHPDQSSEADTDNLVQMAEQVFTGSS